MMMGTPEFTNQIVCGHCGNKAPMKVVAKHDEIVERTVDYPPHSISEGPIWELVKCPACGGMVLRQGYWHECVNDEAGPEFEVIYPQNQKLPQNLPATIHKALLSALRVKAIDPNSFGMLLGRVLDQLCLDQRAQGRTLFERLNDLSEKGILPRKIVDVANGLRDFRNVGSHANLGELTSNEVPLMESLVRVVLEYVYEAPAMVAQAEEKLRVIRASNGGTSGS